MTNTRPYREIALALSMMAVALSAPARAQDAEEVGSRDAEARSLFDAGMQAYAGGRYDEALRHFQHSYELSGRSGLLYNIATAAERSREDETALRAYEEYLEQEPDTRRREQVETRIRALRESIANRPPPAAPSSSISPVGPILLGVGGAAVVAGVITGFFALGDEGELARLCGGDLCAGTAENRALHDRMLAFALATDVLLVAGGVVAALGLVLTLVLREESPAVSATAACNGSGCLAQVGGSF